MTFSALPGQADALTCNMPGVPTDASNLVIKVSHQRLLYSSLEPIDRQNLVLLVGADGHVESLLTVDFQ